LIIAPLTAPGKPTVPIRYRPTRREGLNIQYKLKTSEKSFASLGRKLGITKQSVCDVVLGKRRSARIESEIAKILGKANWNDVVIEARSEIQKKPVEVIVREMKQKHDAKTMAVKENMAAHIAKGVKRMSMQPDKEVAKGRRRA